MRCLVLLPACLFAAAWRVQVVDSGLAEGSCFFSHSASSGGVDHGYLKEADGTLGTRDLQYDLSRRKVVQCETRVLNVKISCTMVCMVYACQNEFRRNSSISQLTFFFIL